MVEQAKRLELSAAEAYPWFQRSLRIGFEPSAAVAKEAMARDGIFFALIQEGLSRNSIRFPEAPDVPGKIARAGLAHFIDEAALSGARSFVIEDDMKRRTEVMEPQVPTAFLGSRVLHWVDLEPGSGAKAVDSIRFSASHFLNAFLVGVSSLQLGLAHLKDVPPDFPEQVASAVIAVVTFAFDETSFAVWNLK